MKRKEVKRFMRANPEFEAWVEEDAMRKTTVKSNPGAVEDLYKRWQDRKKAVLDFNTISQKTKKASEMLTGVQTFMDMMADYTKKL
jgi:hypothetical protein